MELLTNELGQPVKVLEKVENFALPSSAENEGAYLYAAVMAPSISGVNLMEKTSRKAKEKKDTLSGAIVIFVVGAVAGVALTAAGYANRIYQQHELMREVAERAASEYGVEFLYRDFRPYFRAGQERARELGFYIQKYCGCVFSEEERYLKSSKIIR